eukprot:6464269-Amphidinium_carterae.3
MTSTGARLAQRGPWLPSTSVAASSILTRLVFRKEKTLEGTFVSFSFLFFTLFLIALGYVWGQGSDSNVSRVAAKRHVRKNGKHAMQAKLLLQVLQTETLTVRITSNNISLHKHKSSPRALGASNILRASPA